jgi:hypothetical protein
VTNAENDGMQIATVIQTSFSLESIALFTRSS